VRSSAREALKETTITVAISPSTCGRYRVDLVADGVYHPIGNRLLFYDAERLQRRAEEIVARDRANWAHTNPHGCHAFAAKIKEELWK